MENKFTITYEDVAELQKKYTDCLTTDNDPISLLAKANDEREYNEAYEYSINYIRESESYLLDNMEYETHFLQSLNAEERKAILENIDTYSSKLENFKSETINSLKDYDCNIAELVKEYEDGQAEIQEAFYKEFLYGDYREDGIVARLEKKTDYSIEYNKTDGSIEIQKDIDDEDELETKEEFLEYIGRVVNRKIQDKRIKYNETKAEREKQNERRLQSKLQEDERIRKLLTT